MSFSVTWMRIGMAALPTFWPYIFFVMVFLLLRWSTTVHFTPLSSYRLGNATANPDTVTRVSDRANTADHVAGRADTALAPAASRPHATIRPTMLDALRRFRNLQLMLARFE